MNNLGLIFLLIAVALGSLAQVLLKKGGSVISQLSISWQDFIILIKEVLTNFYVMGWVILGGLSALFWIVAISKLNLSFAAPVALSLGIVLTVILAKIFLGENISFMGWIGVFVVILGILLLVNK